MSRKIILIKQELLLLVYELNRSGLLAENEKIRPILAQLEKLLRSEERFSRNAETDLVCRLLLEKKNGGLRAGPDKRPVINGPAGGGAKSSGATDAPDFLSTNQASTEIYTLSLHDALPI